MTSADGSLGAKELFETLTQPFVWGADWQDPVEVAAVNIPMNAFLTGGTTWGDLQSTAHALVLGALGWMAGRGDIGTEYAIGGVKQDFYYGRNLPRTVQFFEPLLAEMDDTVVGIRVWVLVMDPKMSIRAGFAHLIKDNAEIAEDAARAMERMRSSATRRVGAAVHERAYAAAAGTVTGGMTTSPHRRVMSEFALVNSALAKYLGRDRAAPLDASSVDELYSGGALSPGAAYDPTELFGIDTAFTLHVDGVRACQRDVSSYLDADNGAGLLAFRGEFPPGVTGYRVLAQYFSPDLMCGTPLPHLVRAHIEPLYRQFVSERADAAAAADEAAEAAAGGDVRRAVLLEEDRERKEARMAYLVDEMDDKHDAVRRESPSATLGGGSLADTFDASFVEETLLARNAIRQMHAPFTARVAEVHVAFDAAEAEAAAHGAPADEDVRIGGETREEAVVALRLEMLEQFWQVYNKSTLVTPTVNASRKWFATMRFKMRDETAHWTPHFGIADNLSPFGNMIARMTNDFGDALEVETNFQLMHLTLLVVMGAARYKWGLRPNLMVTGEGGIGKSFCIDQAKKITIPGAIMALTHMTQHAMNGGQDISDICIVMEEVPLDMVGVDKVRRSFFFPTPTQPSR